MKEDIDIIAAALNGDRQAVLTDQLERINIQLVTRLAVNITTRESIHQLLADNRQDLLKLEPHHDGLPDDPSTLRERLALKREWRALVRELSEEQRKCWADTQVLRAEARVVEKELLQLKQRDARLDHFS